MAAIAKDSNFLTLINIFTCEPRHQQELVDLLTMATNASIRYIDGFLSSTLHSSIDGTKVAMYPQWRSLEDYQDMRNNPAASPYLARALTIAKFDPGMYRAVETFLPAS